MAITWKAEITPINLSTKEAVITVTRTDDTDPDNPMVYTEPNAIIDTDVLANNVPIANGLWAQHQAEIAKNTVVEDFVSGLEALLKTNLEARE